MVTRRPCRRSKATHQRGFTYLWVLVAISIIGVGLLAVSEVWVTSARSQKLAELDWMGRQFTRAIGSYYESTPGAAKVYPKSLQDLIEDGRYVTVRRHLRVIYRNPFSGAQDWEAVVAADGRIRGVRVLVPGEDGSMVREFIYRPGVVDP